MILNEIASKTKERIARAKEKCSLEEIRALAEALPVSREYPFEKALAEKGMSFICEIKKASPSKGVIAEEFPYLQIAGDAERVMAVIDSFDGALPFNDKANPEVIRREMQMSKNEFKRAVGNLLKNGRIIITETGILRKES